MPRVLSPAALAAILWVAAAGGVAAQSPAAPTATQTVATPGVPGWIAVLWQPVADWSAWAVGWLGAEERIAADDLHRFVRRLAEDSDAIDSLISDAGFSVNAVSVGVGLVPEIALDLDFERRLTPEERAALLARVDAAAGVGGILERSLVDLMLAAADSEYAAERDSGYGLTGLEIDVDLIPRATLVLGPRQPDRTAALAR